MGPQGKKPMRVTQAPCQAPKGSYALSLGKRLNTVRDSAPEKAEAYMGARALRIIGQGFYRVLGQAHNGDATQDKAPTKQGPTIQKKYLDWVESLQPQLWLEKPSSTFVE